MATVRWGLFGLVLAGTAAAQERGWPDLGVRPAATGGGDQDVALVIGIEDYAALEDIAGAKANAQAWRSWLLYGRGLRSDRVRLLLDNEATVTGITDAARELAGKAKGGTFWIVFIGHGAPAKDQSEGVLATWTAQQTEREFYPNALPQSQLEAAAGGSSARRCSSSMRASVARGRPARCWSRDCPRRS